MNRKIILFGETLIQTAVAAAVTGNLTYDRSIEADINSLSKFKDSEILVVATGEAGDAMSLLTDLAYNRNKDLSLKKGDTVIFSSEIYPGESRRMAMILDQFLSMGIQAAVSTKDGVHVSNHAGREELKLMLSITKPRYFVPMLGEGRHIMHHAQLAQEFGMSPENIFPLKNGEILEIENGYANVIGSVEAQAVYYNRGQAESVTAFSVNERRSLSMEGVLNVVLLLSEGGKLLQTPVLDGAALGFLHSSEWLKLKEELIAQIEEQFKEQSKESSVDIVALRAGIRDLVSKAVRSRLGAKPAINVVAHDLSTSRPG